MPAETLFQSSTPSGIDYRGTATPAEEADPQRHTPVSLAHVRQRSVGWWTPRRAVGPAPRASAPTDRLVKRRRSSNGYGRVRRRIIETAMRIGSESRNRLSLEAMASWAGLSPFHFLRVFTRTLGLTPHQYLIRCRLADAA